MTQQNTGFIIVNYASKLFLQELLTAQLLIPHNSSPIPFQMKFRLSITIFSDKQNFHLCLKIWSRDEETMKWCFETYDLNTLGSLGWV